MAKEKNVKVANKPRHKLYDTAETLFVDEGLTSSEIAGQLGISQVTLSKWRTSMGWDGKRSAVVSSPDKIRELLLESLREVTEGKDSKINTDALSKISKALTYFDGKTNLSVVIAVLREFDNWMVGVDPRKAVEITDYHRMFVNHRAARDSVR